jgi:hypothetical protein
MSQVGRWTKGTLAIALVALASLASPWVALSAAQGGGADKPRPATFGDCKNNNAGVHNGYDCEEEEVPTVSGGLT